MTRLGDFERLVAAAVLGGLAYAIFRNALEHLNGAEIKWIH